MNLIKIAKENLPVIEERNMSIEVVEELLIKKPYGCCLVISGDKELKGYIDLRDCKKEKDVLSIMKKPPVFRDINEILSFNQKNKYILWPIVNECNQLKCAYYCSDNYLDIENEELQNLFFLKNNNYCMEHYFTKSKVKNATVALYSDITHIKSSMIFAEELQKSKDVDFLGIYLLSDVRMNMTENIMNYGVNVKYIDSLKEVLDYSEILFINSDNLNMLENLKIVQKKKKRCRYMRTMLRAITDKYYNDCVMIKNKYEYKKKGIDVLTFAIPTSEDVGQRNKETSPKACLNFIIKTIGKGNIEKGKKFNDLRHEFVINQVNDEYQKYFADIHGENFNVTSKCRMVVGTPQQYEKTIYLVGPCIVAGIYVEDVDTLGSKLQKRINEGGGTNVRVVALPIPNDTSRKYFFSTLETLNPVEGDVIVWLDQTFRFMRYDYNCIEEYKQLITQYGTDLYYDIPAHCGAIAMDMIAKNVFDAIKKVDSKNEIDLEKEYKMFVKEETSNKNSLPFEDSIELKKYKQFIKENAAYKKPVIGSIVMNCNPFTFGHQYLIEYASKLVDYLYIFVVEEDKSFFKFADRIELVKRGTSHINNVKVLPSGKFIISANTFSEYFDKANLRGTQIDTSLDVETFAQQIAPCLDITIRFVGEEPLDPITNQYNQTMKEILPRYGIEVREIPRKKQADLVISASRVRKLMEEKRWNEIKEIVPKTTYDFLLENYN